MPTNQKPGEDPRGASAEDARPCYEPPRILKKRSVSRATLVTGAQAEGTPAAIGIITSPG